jgi:hypothetical protein
MSWLTEAVASITKGQSNEQRRQKRAYEDELAAQRAIGPVPKAGDLNLETGGAGETDEQRKKRMRRAALMMQNGGDPYGELTLSNKGLLS